MAQESSQKIGVATATIIGMNAMIGSGIFIVPATLASFVGPAGILAFIFVIISVLFIALSLAKVARLFPEEGSFYTYTKQWGGHILGLIASFSYFFGLIIAMGLLCQIAGVYLHHLFPAIPPLQLGLITLITLVVLNLFGVVLSQLGQYILICTTVFPLIATTLMCLTKIDLNNLIPFAPHGFANVLKATRKIIFGFFGFECAASLFNIVKNPERNVPRALVFSIIIVGTIYTLFVSSIILSTPLELFSNPNIPISETLRVLFPQKTWMIGLIHLSILSAIVGTIHSMIWSSSALFLALLKQFKSATVHSLLANNIITQRVAVVLVGIGIFVAFSSLHNIDLFFNLTALFIVFAYITSIITLLTIKKEWERSYNIPTLLGIGTALMIIYFAVEGLVNAVSGMN
jgi:amino acid transporter